MGKEWHLTMEMTNLGEIITTGEVITMTGEDMLLEEGVVTEEVEADVEEVVEEEMIEDQGEQLLQAGEEPKIRREGEEVEVDVEVEEEGVDIIIITHTKRKVK